MPTRLPLFPLSVVLFPGTPLPLHIFEPRYRRLLTDCLATDRRFGITPPGAADEAPEAGVVGCTAIVRVNQEVPDGRSNIVVLGGERFVVSRLVDEPVPYLVALVEPFEDDPGTVPAPERIAALREEFARYAALVRELSDVEADETELPADALALSFHVAASLDVEARIKQRLLAERSTARRVEALLSVLPALGTVVERALEVHRRAHGNGRGHAMPTIPGA
ncbi:MAG TPA: LON peptidase substrate-binding domain-containing protein [Gemmatimonadales bacterium]|nr:LON peptidase substrate-binding domain-containing protein [Gemmatimonadales bacterium]